MITASISNCENGYAVSISTSLNDEFTRTWVYDNLDEAVARARAAFKSDPIVTSGVFSQDELDDIMGKPI